MVEDLGIRAFGVKSWNCIIFMGGYVYIFLANFMADYLIAKEMRIVPTIF